MDNGLHIVQGNDMYLQIYDYYRNKIAFGAYKCGDRLPTYNALAEEYSVSLTTVKKAYNKLKAEGYITQSRQGSVVSEVPVKPSDALYALMEQAVNKAVASGAGEKDIITAIEKMCDRYC